jgi:hypothetical protein
VTSTDFIEEDFSPLIDCAISMSEFALPSGGISSSPPQNLTRNFLKENSLDEDRIPIPPLGRNGK